jgi:hypothetical protein
MRKKLKPARYSLAGFKNYRDIPEAMVHRMLPLPSKVEYKR